jgi:hypothetical protein
MISMANWVCPADAAMCKGVSTNGISSIVSKIYGSPVPMSARHQYFLAEQHLSNSDPLELREE